MTKLTSDLIAELLLNSSSGPAVTIYMPTHPAHSPPNMSEDQLRYKNLHSRAIDIIRNTPEVNNDVLAAIDQHLESIQEDLGFWEEQMRGLAILANPDGITTVQLPIDCDEYLAVDERFHVSPLLGLLYNLDKYYVLLISEKEPLLFSGDMYNLREMNIPMPASGRSGSLTLEENKLAERLAPQRVDSQPTYFGANSPVTNDGERLQFFHLVDRAIRSETKALCPLILAGTEEDIADYRRISDYPNILAGQLPNATTEADIRRIFPEAVAIIRKEIIAPRRQQVLERYEQLLGNGSGLASDDPAAIEDAADKGRIHTLLLRMIRYTSDTLGNGTAEVPKLVFLPDEQMAIADYVAIQTWRNRGTIMPLEDKSDVPTPTGTVMSAIFRY